MKRILVAGIGNIFLGDDAFGVEALNQLVKQPLPEEVAAVDFGIRAYDLAYAITENYDAVILVDAAPRGATPGTVSLISPDLENLDNTAPANLDAHSLDPVQVLQMVRSLGGRIERLFLVACEPADLGGDEGRMGLSEPVAAAIAPAVEMIRSLIDDLLRTAPGQNPHELERSPS